MPEKYVEILGGTSGRKGAYLDYAQDLKTGRYFAPELTDPGILKMHAMGLTGKGTTTAIIDTGLMSQHPWIRRSMIDSVDFSGEGTEDLNGHGTMVALLYLMTAPDSKIINVKVMDALGTGTEEALVSGIRYAMEKQVQCINISAGMDHRKWGFLECNGSCTLCQAAEEAAKQGISVVVAAGNTPDTTACPARVGLVKKDSGVISVAAYDMDQMKIAPYSGKGNIAAPVGARRFIPVE